MILKFPAKSFCYGLILWSSLALSGYSGTVGSGDSSLVSAADREIVRRQEEVLLAEGLAAKGDQALAAGDYETAYLNYLDAVEKIPASPEFARQRTPVLKKFCSGALAYANWLAQQGRFSDAEKVAKTILLPQFDPSYRPAAVFLSRLEQPGVFNKTVTPEFTETKAQVAKLLNEAEGFYATGRYDLAKKRYNAVLELDHYNTAAREGMERLNLERSEYYAAARNETRTRLIWQVGKAWELPVPSSKTKNRVIQDVTKDTKGTELIQNKLNRIILPKVDLADRSVREAIDFLKQQSERLDTTSDPNRRGVNIILRADQPAAAAPATPDGTGTAVEPAIPIANRTINLQLANVPLSEALRYVARLAGLKIKLEPYAVSLVPLSDVSGDFIIKEYRVPAGFIPPSVPNASASASGPSFSLDTPSGTQPLPGRADAKSYLESVNIPFPPGASATYIAAGSRLVIRNTLDNMDLIDAYIDAQTGGTPTQVEIESRFVEINQNDLKELGFDWLVGPFAIGSSGVYGAGGSVTTNPSQYPFDINGAVVGANTVTSGLRTGSGASPSSAVTVNSLDALLNAASGAALTSAAAPAIVGLSGIFTNPQFQVVIRGLDQKKGVDLMTAPKITTKSGLQATVKIAREFIYPTEFDPPQIPQETTSNNGNGGSVAANSIVFNTPGAVTPSFPTGWATRNLGVTLLVTPTIGPDNYTIDLDIEPEVVDFDGFVNYGSPINSVGYRPQFPGSDLLAVGTVFIPEVQVLTQNVINQPIFTMRKVTTSVTIWDGQTVALGGLIREDVQKVQDKVPIIGDIPLAGRLFRSSVDQKIKKNLIVFVTAKLVDAQGQPLRSIDEEDEIIEPVGLPADLPRPQFQMKGGK